MNNELKFNYIKQHWQLRDGVVYTRWGNKSYILNDDE